MPPSFALEVEYSKSARAACKQCKAKIDKDEVRFGLKAKGPEGEEGGEKNHILEAVKWHHFACLPRAKGAAWFKKHFPASPAEAIQGLDALRDEHRPAAEALFQACRGEGPVPAAPSASGAATIAASGALVAKPGETPAKTSGKRKAKADAEEAPPAKKAQGLTATQIAAMAVAKEQLSSKGAAYLQELCKVNGLPKSGRKDELLERCAECKALGVPPTCPRCEKVKLKFSMSTGTYSCPGHFDADDKVFKRCKGPEASDKLERTPWKELK